MTHKNLIILTLILMLGLASIVGRNLWTAYQAKIPNGYQETLKNFDVEKINQILVSQSGQEVVMRKEDGMWKIASRSADPAKIEELIKAFFPPESPLLLAETNQQRESLSLTEASRTLVRMGNLNNQSIDFYIGKPSSLLRPVNIAEQQQIYGLADFPALDASVESWYDLKIVDIDSTQIKSISITQGKSVVSMEQFEDNKWKFLPEKEKDKQTNDDAINTYLYSFNPLQSQALAFEQNLKDYPQKNPVLTLELIQKNDESVRLEFYKGKDDYLVKKSSDGSMYIIDSEKFMALAKNQQSFLALQP